MTAVGLSAEVTFIPPSMQQKQHRAITRRDVSLSLIPRTAGLSSIPGTALAKLSVLPVSLRRKFYTNYPLAPRANELKLVSRIICDLSIFCVPLLFSVR